MRLVCVAELAVYLVGDKEKEDGTVSVRSRKDGDLGVMKRDEIIGKLIIEDKKENISAVFKRSGNDFVIPGTSLKGVLRSHAAYILDGLKSAGYEVSGGVNAPYIWLKTPDNMTSWDFFDKLLKNAQVVGTPGVGFGPHGEGYFRLTAFGDYESTKEAMARIKNM